MVIVSTMTKTEAIEAISRVIKPSEDLNKQAVLDWINAIEVLGLITFKPEIDYNNEAAIQLSKATNQDGRFKVGYGWAYEVVKQLEKNGYKVVKK